MAATVSRTTYMSLSVRGAIRGLQKQRSKKTYLTDDAGRPLSKEQAIDALMDELTKGRETIPMGPKCGNPCKQAGCAGFDYGEHGGCAGFPTPSEAQS